MDGAQPRCSSSRSPRPPGQQERLPRVRDLPVGVQAFPGTKPPPTFCFSSWGLGLLSVHTCLAGGQAPRWQVAPRACKTLGKAGWVGKSPPPQSAATRPTPQGTATCDQDHGACPPKDREEGGYVGAKARLGRGGCSRDPCGCLLSTSFCLCCLMPVGGDDLDCHRGATWRRRGGEGRNYHSPPPAPLSPSPTLPLGWRRARAAGLSDPDSVVPLTPETSAHPGAVTPPRKPHATKGIHP